MLADSQQYVETIALLSLASKRDIKSVTFGSPAAEQLSSSFRMDIVPSNLQYSFLVHSWFGNFYHIFNLLISVLHSFAELKKKAASASFFFFFSSELRYIVRWAQMCSVLRCHACLHVHICIVCIVDTENQHIHAIVWTEYVLRIFHSNNNCMERKQKKKTINHTPGPKFREELKQ